jgi:hypothetical protein
MTSGAFEIEDDTLDEFHIKLREREDPVPEDQRELHFQVYATVGVLKLLRDYGMFGKDKARHHLIEEFRKRIVQVATVGLTGKNVQREVAVGALDQVRKELVNRWGRRVVYKYLTRLAGCAALGIVAGALLETVSQRAPALAGYGLVLIGAMVGAWLSVASSRTSVTFDALPDFLGVRAEPAIRMGFAGLLALVVALFLQIGVMNITLGSVSLATFHEARLVALLLGLVSGIGEKALSPRVIARAGEIVTK